MPAQKGADLEQICKTCNVSKRSAFDAGVECQLWFFSQFLRRQKGGEYPLESLRNKKRKKFKKKNIKTKKKTFEPITLKFRFKIRFLISLTFFFIRYCARVGDG